jgi:hypothetical protein
MANEAALNWNLSIRKDNLIHRDNGSFQVDVSGTLGPVPGGVTVPMTGRIVDFQGFIVEPGMCVVKNYDETYSFEVGIYDLQTNVFYPLSEVGPGESYPLKLSRNLLEQYDDTGTGTSAPENKLMLKGIGNPTPINAYLGAFEK